MSQLPTSASASIALATLATLAALLALVILKQRELRQRQPPGPATLPFIGNMHQVMWNKPVMSRWIHRLLEEMGTDMICLRLRDTHFFFASSPETVREVLRKKDAVFASRPATLASRIFSFGYKGSTLSPHGEHWKNMRRVLTSEILAPSMEKQLQHLREEESDNLVRYIYNTSCSSDIVDVRHVAQHFCANTIRRLAIGRRYFRDPAPEAALSWKGGPGHDEVAHARALFMILDLLYGFCVSNHFPSLARLDLDRHLKVVRDVAKTLNRLHNPIIEQRMREWSVLREGGERREAKDFLDVLVSLEDAEGHPLLSIEEIQAQLLEIMFASVDSPSNATEWALAEMMNKPEIMQKATDELDAVVGKDRLVQESDIPKLKYLTSCIREALRLHPFHALHQPRVAMEDTTIAGYMIPKGSHVILSRVALGRNPKIWQKPLEFWPERHLNGTSDDNVVLGEPGLRFISFGTGRRGCPGVSLGTTIAMMLFARILQGFTWMEAPGVGKISLQESENGISLAEPLLLQAKPRLAAHLYEAN